MRIFVASLSTETNTFAASPTGAGAWNIDRGDHVGPDGKPLPNAWRDLVEALASETGDEAVVGILADAQPDGPTVRSVYESLRDEMLDNLRAAMPVGAVVLPLHGAMVAEGYPDCEGDLIERVRQLVGHDVAIGVELDLHCHFTERMRHSADVIVAYKEYPHTDVMDRFKDVWRLTVATANGKIKPVTAVHDCRMVAFWHTTREPMRSFVQRMTDLEGQQGVLNVSFGQGFPYGDVPEAGAKVWVVTDGDQALASRLAAQLGREIWEMRHRTAARQDTLPYAIGQLQAQVAGSKPVVIADIADNPGGGASSDSTFILRALLDAGIGNVALGAFWDLGALQICRDAGRGARIRLRLGGKCGPASGDPVDLGVTVRAVVDEHEQSVEGYPAFACGPSAWISTDNALDIVLISRRQQVYATNLFTGLGIDLRSKRGIVVKSSQHFHFDFSPLAGEVLYVETPGLLRTDFANIPYRHRDLNFWPRVEDPWGQAGPGGCP
jgi:microcystin degradation protein MlrC